MCFLAIFILCVPLLCFCVFAENIKIDLAYYGIDTFNYNTDGLKFNSDDINSSGGLLFSAKNFIATKISKDDLRIKYQNDVNGRYYNIPPYDYIEYSDGTYSIRAVGDKYIQFLNGLDYLHSSTSLNNFVINYNSEQNYYYFVFYYSYSTPDNYYDSNGSSSRFEEVTHIDTSRCVTYISTTPFSFKSSPNGYYLDGSQKYVAITGNSVSSGLYNGDPFTTCHSFNNYSSEESILFDKNMIYQFNNDSVVNYNFLGAYTNCDIDVSMFDNTDNLHKGITDLKPKTFSEKVSVKLTPQFNYDMDRFDSSTNQNEYFKFEITNNSTKSIQWLACIYDQTLLTSDTMYLDGLSNWTYLCKESYYTSSVKEEKGVFRTTWTYDGALTTGSYYYHVLLPGQTYSDIIYWENVKILPNKIYTFNVNAFPTDLNNPTENINPVVTGESSDIHSITKCKEDYFKTILKYDGSTDGYRTIESCVYSKEFSVLTIPAFTTTVRNGNSVPNGGATDSYRQRQNYETQSDINGMDTKINKNYVDPTILANSLNDVDINLDNIGVDDVKGYISYSQNFFKLIKMSFQTFPAIWTLVVFGLTAIIVIAILRYIRG